MKIVLFFFILSFINYSCSLFNYLQPHNYILSNNWRLSRDKPLNIGWNNEDHNSSTIHSITTSYNNQYIITCSNDNIAKFHRVLMYPNLYPDWTHLYYGSLKLRGFNSEVNEIETLKCISSRDGDQLIVLSINKNIQNIYIDIYQKVELDYIENRKPIIKRKGRESYKNINEVYSDFNIVFPLDDYNEIWVNISDISTIEKYLSSNSLNKSNNNIHSSEKSFKSQKYRYKQSSTLLKPIIQLSPNGKSLLISYNNIIIVQQLDLNKNEKNNYKLKNNNSIRINNNYIIKDIKFVPDNSNQYNSFLLLVNDNSNNDKSTTPSSLLSIKKNKIIIYKYNSDNKVFIEKELELPYILSNSVRMVSNKDRGDDFDCINNNNKTYKQPLLVAFQDLDYTVHLTQLVINDNSREYFIIIKSLPIPIQQEYSPNSQTDPNDKVLIDFSKDSTLISIQYPNSNIIYIYKKESIINGIYDYKLKTIIDELPIKSSLNGDVLLFNFKYNYLVTNFGGHLSFFRDIVNPVSQCDKSSRTKSYYLPSPPLNEVNIKYNGNESSNSSNNKLVLEQYGLLYILKIDQVQLNLVKIKYVVFTIIGFIIIHSLQRSIIQFEDLFIGPFLERVLKRINIKLTISKVQSVVFYLLAIIILLFSFYEIINEPTFTNDWPAHIHHIDQFLNPPSHNNSIFNNYVITNQNQYNGNHYFKSITTSIVKDQFHNKKYLESLVPNSIKSKFDLDYSHYMHYHGPNTYPAGFIYLYTLLYYISNMGNTLQIFQIVWAVLEFINFILIKRICSRLQLPIYLSILPIISNRLHLYNVRIVINDFPSTILIHIGILLILSKRFKLFSVLYSITVSLKLHTIFYSPSILFIFFNSNLSIYQIITNLSIMASIQLLFGLPFLLVNPVAYISNAYDFSRTLLWEKTRNFKFIGRLIYDMKLFNLLLLLLLVFSIVIFIIKYQKIINKLKELENKKNVKELKLNDIKNYKYYDKSSLELIINRVFILSFIGINFLATVWARGLYTPFMCWYFYTFPIILYFSEFSVSFIIIYWVSHEILFRAFSDLYIEMFATYLFFNINISIIIRLFKMFNPHHKNNIKIYNLNKSNQELINNKKIN